jgi:hypothetical protein
MNTWLSGMSPVEAELASACRPDGEAAVEVAVVVEGVVFVVVDFVAGGALALFELPHPESSASANAPHVIDKMPMGRRVILEIVATVA